MEEHDSRGESCSAAAAAAVVAVESSVALDMATSERQAVYFYADDDIESVILSGDESSSSSTHEETLVSDEDENPEEIGDDVEEEDDNEKDDTESQIDKENEEYYRFVVSVMLNESDQSGNDDGDDDEDYVPESDPPNKDLDFEEDDDGYYRVTRKEIMELVNAGVRELAKIPDVKKTASTQVQSQERKQLPGVSKVLLPVHDPSLTLLSPNLPPPQQLPPPPPFAHPIFYPHPASQLEQPAPNPIEDPKKNRLLSALIQKMFAGTGDEDLVVDDMPINNIRKLVARQMTMAVQLLIQMLLMSDNFSEVDQQLASSLLELSNLKDAGVRKTALLKEQLESIKLYSSSMASAPLVYMRQLSDSDDETGGESTDEGSRHNILTRRRTLAMASSSTLFSVKALSNVSDLLQTVDAVRKERNQLLPTEVTSPQMQENNEIPTQRSLLSSHANRKALFPILKDLMETRIAPKFCERVWNCLLPTECYPLGEEFAQTVDPTSLFQRSIFTPAEDDLLLRGMIVTNSESNTTAANTDGTDWEEVHKRFLPSKDKRLLQFRQIQLISSEENTKFQRYRELEMENKIHNSSRKWTREEEISLLRGFQIFGNKWHMVKLYFLPYKTRNEIRLRWMYLLKLWEKAELNIKASVKSDGTLHKSTRNFLRSIQHSSTPSLAPSSSSLPHAALTARIPSLLGKFPPVPSPSPPFAVPPFARAPSKPSSLPQQSQPYPTASISNSSKSSSIPPLTATTGMSSLQPHHDDAVDEGVLPDSDSDNQEEVSNSSATPTPNQSRKRGQSNLPTPPMKRMQTNLTDSSQPSGGGSQSLFASVMSQVNTGGPL